MKRMLTLLANWLFPDDTHLLLQPIVWILIIATFFAFLSVGILPAIKLVFFILFYCSIPALALYKMNIKGKLRFRLNHESLLSQPLFYLAIAIPAWSFLYFGLFAWWGNTPRLDATGFNNFITESRLPLSLLAMAVPLAALVGAVHRSIQTAKQIKHGELKSEDESEDRTQETAVMCLKKAFELLNSEGKPTRHAALWSTAKDLINDYSSIKITINKPEIEQQLQTQEKYWKAKFKAVLVQTSQDDFYFIKTAGVSKNTMISIANFCNSDVIAKHIEKDQGKVIYQDESRELRTAYHPKPEDVMEDAVLAGPSDDPIVTEERKRRGLE